MRRESRELGSSLDFPAHLLSGPRQVELGFGCVICEGGQMGLIPRFLALGGPLPPWLTVDADSGAFSMLAGFFLESKRPHNFLVSLPARLTPSRS